MTKFVVTIELGNDAMNEAADVAAALARIAKDLVTIGWPFRDGRPIRDINGNRVGTYHVENA
jgi:hypothetical protein